MPDLSQYSDADLMKAAGIQSQSDLSQLSDEELMKAAGVDPAEGNFFQRFGGDLQNRLDMVKTSDNAYLSGQQSLPESVIQILGNGVVGTANDLVGQGVKSIASNLPQQIKDAGSNVLNTVGSLPSFGGGTLSQGLPKDISTVEGAYNNFAQDNPRSARNIGAVANLGGLALAATPVKGMSAVDAVAGMGKKSANALDRISDVVVNAANDELPVPRKSTGQLRAEQTSDLRKSASDLYKDSSSQGISFDDKDSANLAVALNKLRPKTDLETRSWDTSAAAKQVQDITESLKAENPTLNGMLAKRNELNSQIKVATRSGNDAEAYKLNRVKDALDETMMNGDTKTWQLANHQWAQQAVLGDTDEIVNKALTRAQPANSLDTAINNYLSSYKSKGLSDEEWQALKEVTNNSSFDKLRKGAASGLLKFSTGAAGAHFGPAGSAAGYLMGHYGSEFLKDSAMAAKVEKLDKFRDMIMSRTPPDATQAKSISEKIKANSGKQK